MNKIEKIQSLIRELNTYRHEYYNLNKPSVSDSYYDRLFDELSNLEKETGFLMSNSPTQSVGYEVKSKLTKVTHPIPLRSLDKTKSVEDLKKLIVDKDSILMLKADGLTIELIYENGNLIQGSTRGNGEIGEDVTHNVKVFKNVPLSIEYKGRFKVVGEAVIHKNDFDIINSKLSENDKKATPRNLVAGSVRQLDSKICSQREVYFYAFGILEGEVPDSKYQQFSWLRKQGFSTILNIHIGSVYDTPIYQLENYINTLKDMADIPIDGMVISYDSTEYSNSLGSTSHHPLHSLAFKFKDAAQTTTLKAIEWSVGRTSIITPVAIFDTVILDNTEVNRASVHNISILEELELGLGDEISIIKANMIIPQIEENFTRSNNIKIPTKCPSCGENTKIEQLNDSRVLKCTNSNCPAQLIKKFSHFVSRDAMNIEGLSEATLEKFIQKGFIETLSDIYRLEQYKNDIVKMDGFGIKSYNKLIQAIEKSKDVNMANFIYSLGILQIGKGGAKRLVKHFNNDMNKFLEATKNALNFVRIEDFGEVTAYSVYEYFFSTDNYNEVIELLKIVNIKQSEIKSEVRDNPFLGRKVYATGSFANYKKEEIKKVLENLGAEFASGYAKSLDYLIVGSIKGSSKEDKARKDGIPILMEEEFNRMIGK